MQAARAADWRTLHRPRCQAAPAQGGGDPSLAKPRPREMKKMKKGERGSAALESLSSRFCFSISLITGFLCLLIWVLLGLASEEPRLGARKSPVPSLLLFFCLLIRACPPAAQTALPSVHSLIHVLIGIPRRPSRTKIILPAVPTAEPPSFWCPRLPPLPPLAVRNSGAVLVSLLLPIRT